MTEQAKEMLELAACPQCKSPAERPRFTRGIASCSNRKCRQCKTGMSIENWNKKAAAIGSAT